MCIRDRSILTGRSAVMLKPDSFTSASTHCDAQKRIALGSFDLQAFTRFLASFLYFLRSGRGGSGRAACGLGNMRISFQCLPGVRTDQAERRFVTFINSLQGGHGPFRGLEASHTLGASVSLSEMSSQQEPGVACIPASFNEARIDLFIRSVD